MKYNLIALACALLLAAGLSLTVTAGPTTDTDTDGVVDPLDNCVVMPNGTQADSDLDGYGNPCDSDFNNSGLVAGDDFLTFAAAFNTSAPTYNQQTDQDCSGLVAGNDFLTFSSNFNAAPGPSGLACAGNKVPCPGWAHVCP